jgi:hypothetical protein
MSRNRDEIDAMSVGTFKTPDQMKGGPFYPIGYNDDPEGKIVHWQVAGGFMEIETTRVKRKEIEPGIYSVRKSGYSDVTLVKRVVLAEENFDGLTDFPIKEKIVTFLSKADEYTSRKLLPKRGILLHGKPGCGKTHGINMTINEILGERGIAFFLSMDEVGVESFVSFLERNKFEAFDKVFIVIEDLGGGEMADRKMFMMPSTSHLLALLDGNSLPWRDIPTVILSTTNYPANFLANILDRPGRFDEVVEVKLPTGEALVRYAESLKVDLTDFDKMEIKKGELSVAHIRESVVKYLVYGTPIFETVRKMREYSAKVQADATAKMDPYAP